MYYKLSKYWIIGFLEASFGLLGYNRLEYVIIGLSWDASVLLCGLHEKLLGVTHTSSVFTPQYSLIYHTRSMFGDTGTNVRLGNKTWVQVYDLWHWPPWQIPFIGFGEIGHLMPLKNVIIENTLVAY